MSGFAYDIETKSITKTSIPVFHIGDTVDVGVRIKEGDKERVQTFTGIVIARRGGGLRETFTVRRIVEGEGVERIFPLHSPNVVSIEVKRAGKVRRAKLYYLRKRVGKATRVEELLNAEHLGKLDESRSKKLTEDEAKALAEVEAKQKAEASAAAKAKRAEKQKARDAAKQAEAVKGKK